MYIFCMHLPQVWHSTSVGMQALFSYHSPLKITRCAKSPYLFSPSLFFVFLFSCSSFICFYIPWLCPRFCRCTWTTQEISMNVCIHWYDWTRFSNWEYTSSSSLHLYIEERRWYYYKRTIAILDTSPPTYLLCLHTQLLKQHLKYHFYFTLVFLSFAIISKIKLIW